MKTMIEKIFSARILALMVAVCATGGAWAASYKYSNVDSDTLAVASDGLYNINTTLQFTLNNPSANHATSDFPDSGYALLTSISIAARSNNANQGAKMAILTKNGSAESYPAKVTYSDSPGFTAYGPDSWTRREVHVSFGTVGVVVDTTATYTLTFPETTGCSAVRKGSGDWKPAMRIYGTTLHQYISSNTSVSALNNIIEASSDSEVIFGVANGVEIEVDEAFSTSSHSVKISSQGKITLSAETQPDASYFSGVDFSGVMGGVLRSWLTPGVVGYNFRSTSGSDTSLALVSGGTWLPASTANAASGSTTEMFADGLSTFSWSSANTYYYNSGTLIDGYLDDGGSQANVALSNVPYETYDVIVYAATDTENRQFRPVTVNGTRYTWDGNSGEAVAGNTNWGASRNLLAEYGINVLRIKNLSGPLTIIGGNNASNGRGGIAAVQIMPSGTLDSDYTLTLDGSATSWSTGTWTLNGETVSAPSEAHSVEIVASASTTLTIDTAAKVAHLIIKGSGAATVTISKGSAALTTKQVTVESGILKHGSDNSPLGAPSLIVVNDGGAMDLGTAPSSGYYTKIAGQGVLKDGVYTGALFSSANITGGSAQLCGITLTANATIRCDRNWGIIRAGWNPGTLNLGSYTLTKVGSENFWICNVTDSASGNIVVSEGRFATIKNKSTFSNATLTIGASATLRMDTSDGGGATDLEVKNLICDAGSTVNIAAARTLTVTTALTANGTMKPLGTVTCNGNMTIGGDVVVPSDKTWTVAGTLTVANGGKLEIKNNALVPGTLALADGGTLKIANVSDAAHKVTAGTVTFPASGAAIIDVSDIPDLDENDEIDVLTGNTSLPSDVSTLKIVGKQCSLKSESNTLKVVNDGGLVWDDGWTTGKDPTKYGDAIIASSGTVALGGTSLSFNSVTLSGSGTVSFSATGSETVSIKNLEIGAGVTLTANAALDLTGCTITGDGTLDIPVGTTYAMDGVTSSAKVTVEGTLETSGTTTLSGANTSAAGSLIRVVDGVSCVAFNQAQIKGNITIDAEAELSLTGVVNDYAWDPVNPSGNLSIDVSGILNVNNSVVYLYPSVTLKLRSGALIKGNGAWPSDSYGAIGWLYTAPVMVYGNAEIQARINTNNGTSPIFTINDGVTLTISRDFTPQSGSYGGGSITKAGAGTLKLSNVSMTKPILGSEGTVWLDAAGTKLVHTATGSTFSGVLKLTNTGSTQNNFEPSGATCFTDDARPEFILNSTDTYFNTYYNNKKFYVSNFSGSGNFKANYTTGPLTYTINTKQTKDTEFSGVFNTEGNRASCLEVVGAGSAPVHTLTLSGVNTTTNTLTVSDYGKVVFSNTGSWANGVVQVGANGVLESQHDANVAGSLVLEAGSVLAYGNSSETIKASGALTPPVSGKVTVDVSNLTIAANASKELLTVGSGMNVNKFSQVGNTETHVLSASGQTLSLVPIAATVTASSGTTSYATLDGAIMGLAGFSVSDPDAYVTLVNASSSDLTITAEQLAAAGIVYDESDGTYGFAAAEISSTKYTTVAKAIAAAASSGDTVTLLRDCTVTDLSLAGKMIILDEGEFTFTGSFTGNGTLALPTLLKSPSPYRWAEGWTGTVELPSFAATGQQLNDYGVSGSKIKINGVTGGYLYWEDQNILPEIVLAGNFNITDMSQRNYTFSKFSGTGNITFSPGTYELTGLTITELAEGYSGTVSNSMSSTTLNIGTLALSEGASVAAGTKLLAIGGTGTIRVGSVTVGGVTQSGLQLAYASDGVYVARASYDGNGYTSVAAAIDAAVAAGGDVSTITILDGSTTLPAGYEQYYIDNGTICKYQFAVVTVAATTTTNYMATAQAAADDADGAMNKYVVLYTTASIDAARDIMIECVGDVSVTLNCTVAGKSYGDPIAVPGFSGLYAYSPRAIATTFVWNSSVPSGSWSDVANWECDDGIVTSAPNNALYTEVFESDAEVSLGSDLATAGIEIKANVTFSRANNQYPTINGGIVLKTADATLTVGEGVTVSTVSTSLEGKRVKVDNNVYSLVDAIPGSSGDAGYVDGTIAIITNTTSAVTIPASATAVAAQPTTSAFVIVATAAQLTTPNFLTITAKYGASGTQDITSAFVSQVIGGDPSAAQLRMTLTGSQTVTVSGNEISVSPQVAASSPMTLDDNEDDDTEASFTIKTIPGLYYAVQTGAFNGSGVWVPDEYGDAVQATSASTSVTAPEFSGTVQYYKIGVGLSAADVSPTP